MCEHLICWSEKDTKQFCLADLFKMNYWKWRIIVSKGQSKAISFVLNINTVNSTYLICSIFILFIGVVHMHISDLPPDHSLPDRIKCDQNLDPGCPA